MIYVSNFDVENVPPQNHGQLLDFWLFQAASHNNKTFSRSSKLSEKYGYRNETSDVVVVVL